MRSRNIVMCPSMNKVFPPFTRAHLIISAETCDNVSGLGDKQKVVHVLHGLADAVAAAVTAFGLTWIVWSLFRATFYL